MRANIAILLIVGIVTYALTLYLGQNNISPNVNDVPDKDAIQKSYENQQAVPNFTFVDIKGKSYEAKDFAGKIVILNFWASWCTPCIKEFPNLLNVADKYQDDVVLIALSSDLDKAAIIKFIKKMKATQNLNFDASNILIALDEDQKVTAGVFSTFKLPETIILDRHQAIRHKLVGADWGLEDLQGIIEELK